MARAEQPARTTRGARDEWSCSLCTLLNAWRESICAACGNEREEEEPEAVSTASVPMGSSTTDPNNNTIKRRGETSDADVVAPLMNNGGSAKFDELMGVFFMSTSTTNDWMQEPRLRVNRKKRPLPPTSAASFYSSVALPNGPTSSTPFMQTREFEDGETTATAGGDFDAFPPTQQPVASPFGGRSPATHHHDDEYKHDDDAMDEDGLPEAPTFNLLGFGNPPVSSSPAGAQEEQENYGPTQENAPSFRLLGNASIDLTDAVEDDNPIKHDDTADQLAKVGLRLSDSDSDEEKTPVRQKLRRRDRNTTPTLSQRSNAHASEPPPEPAEHMTDAPWECHICTETNPACVLRCELCNSKRKQPNNDGDGGYQNERHSQSAQVEAQDLVECQVCTHMNNRNADRCELCETAIGNRNSYTKSDSRYDCIDLAASQHEYGNDFESEGEAEYEPRGHGDRAGFYDDEDDFENPYAAIPASPIRSDRRANDRSGFDNVEDISDNEMFSARALDSQPPPRSKRPELQEFEHFLSVEDARLDYQCQVDYRGMFAESSCSRSYADRLVKRRRESQKRKRTQAQPGAAPSKKASKKSAKATKASGKKAKAAARRASTGREPAAKKPRKQRSDAGATRRASAPAFASSSTISHYDTGGAFDDEVTTMAWEGIGSAGYF